MISGLVYWFEQQGMDVTRERLLDLGLIARYADEGLLNLAPNTRKNVLTSLRTFVRADRGRLFTDHREPSPRDRGDPKQPYSPAQVDDLLAWAAAESTAHRRHAVLAIAGLSLGAGLTSDDIETVRGSDVTTRPDGTVTVTVGGDRPRTTVALRRYEPLLRSAADFTGPRWIVNPSMDPTTDPERNWVAGQLGHLPRPTSGPHFTVVRARITWTCVHLAAGVPLHVLADAAGVTAESLARYAEFLTPLPEPDARRLLRGP